MPLQGNRTSSNGWVDQAEAIQNLTAQANQAELEKQRRQDENAYREQWNAAQVSPWVMSQAKKTTQLPVSAAQSDPSGRHVTTNGTDVNRTAAQAGLNTTRLNENLQRQEAYRTAMKESPESYQKVREQYEQKPDLDQRPSYQKNQSASVPGIDPANWAPSYQRAQTPLEQEKEAPNLTVKEQREVDRRAKAENLEQQRPALKAAADNLAQLGKEIEEAGRQILDAEAKYNRDPSSENLQAYTTQVLQQQRRVDLYNQMYGTYETSRSQYDTEKSAYDKEYDDAVRYAGMDYDALSQYIKNIQNTRPRDATDQEKMSLEIQRAKAYQRTIATTKQLEAEYARVEALRDAEREQYDWSKVDTHDAIRAGELAELDAASSKARLKTLNEELRQLQAALDTAEDNDDRIAYLQYAAGNKGANIPKVREGKTAKALQEIEKTLGAGALNSLLNEGANPTALITDEKTLDASIARLLPYMDEAEKNAFRTFVSSSDWAHAGDFLDTLRPKLEAMAAKADTEAITKFGGQSFGNAAASTFMAGTVGALGAQTAYFDNLYTALNNKLVDAFSLGKYRTSDVNSGAYAASRAAQDFSGAAQAYNAKVGEQNKLLGDTLNQLSGATSSALSNVIQMAMFGKYMLPVMATQAAGSKTTEMLRSGSSAEDAAFMSTMSGIVEYLTEKVPLEHMLDRIGQIADLKKGGLIDLPDVMRMIRDQGMEEASEEVIGNIAENLIDIAYNGSNSEFGKFESELRMMGYSNAEARTQAFNKFFVGDSVEAAVSAFISSAMLLGPTAVMQNSQMRKIGNQVLDHGSAIEEAAKALELPDSEDYAQGRKAGQRVQEALDAGKQIDPRVLGYAAERNQAYAAELIQQGMDLQYSEAQAMSYVLADRLQNNDPITQKELQTLSAQIEKDSADHYTTEQLETAGRNVETQMSYYATQFMRDAGLSAKDAQERCVVLNDLLRGETDLTDKDFQKLDMNSAVTRRIFTELTGIDIPEGIHESKDLKTFYKLAPEGAAAKARQAAVANDRAILEQAFVQQQKTKNLREAAGKALQLAAQERAEATAAQQKAIEESKARNLLDRVFGRPKTKEENKNVKPSVPDRSSGRDVSQPDNGSNQQAHREESELARDGKVRATGERVSAAGLKLEGGSAIAISRTYTQSEYTDEMKSVEKENKKIGAKTVFLDHDLVLRAKNGDYIYARGVWDPKTKTIYINANHSRWSVSEINDHEMFHALKDDAGLSLEDARDQFVEDYGQETYDKIVDRYEKGIGSGLTNLEYFEEFLADANGRMQSAKGVDAAAYHDFAAGLVSGENKSAAQEGGGEAKLSTDTEYTDTAQPDITRDYKKTVHDILDGTVRTNKPVLMGYTPELFVRLGLPRIPFVVGSGHIYSMAKTKAEAVAEGRDVSGAHYHGMGEAAVQDLYEKIKDPIMVIAAKDVDPNEEPLRSTHSVVAIVDIGSGTEHLLMPVAITRNVGSKKNAMDVNMLSTSYPKDVSGLIREAVAQYNTGEKSIFYVKKGEAGLLYDRAGVQSPQAARRAPSSLEGIIHQIPEKVNMEISHETQSTQFLRWFGDWLNNRGRVSKAVDKNGEPMVLYHNTNADGITVFDPDHGGGQGRTHGDGVYLSSSPTEFAYAGKNQYQLYASIKNPFEMQLTRNQARRVLEKYGSTKHDLDKYDGLYRNHAMAKLLSPTRVFDYLTEYAEDNGIKVSDILKDLGFDGVHDGPEWVAFDPAQVKSVTDNVGTFDKKNPDIRFSQDTDNEQRLDDLEVQRQELIDQLDFAEGSEEKELNNRLAKVNYEIDRINAEERRAAVSTPIGNILKNIDDYRRIDLISIGNQYSDGNWDGIESMTKPELVSELRDVLQNQADEDPGIRYYVRPITSQNDNITRVRFATDTDMTNPMGADVMEESLTSTDAESIAKLQDPANASKPNDTSKTQAIVETVKERIGPKTSVDTDESTRVNDDPEQHTPEEQRIIEEYKNAVDEDLVAFYQQSKGKNEGKPFRLKDVSDRGARDIYSLTRHDVRGFGTKLDVRQASHIDRDHGKAGRSDHTMADDNDVGRIQYVLDNYDNVQYGGTTDAYWEPKTNGKKRQAPVVVFSKKINGTYYVVEAVPVTKARSVNVVSAYMLAEGKTPPGRMGTKKPGATLQSPDAYAPWFTAKTDAANNAPDTGTVSQPGSSVKTSIDTDLMDIMREQGADMKVWSEEAYQRAYDTLMNMTFAPNRTELPKAKESVGAAKSAFEHKQKISQYRLNTLNAVTTQAEQQNEGLREEDMTYDVVTEKESVAGARARLEQDFDGEVNDLLRRSDWSGEDVDTAMLSLGVMLDEGAKSGDYNKAVQLAQRIRERATQGGQFVQAFAKYSRHTGAGLLVRNLETMEKIWQEQGIEESKKKHGVPKDVPGRLTQKKKNELIRAMTETATTLDAMEQGDTDTLIDIIVRQAKLRNTRVSDRVLKDLRKTASEPDGFQYLRQFAETQFLQIPLDYQRASLGKRLSTYQTISHLLNLRTAGRNVVSNTVFDMAESAANNLALGIDAMIGKATGQRTIGWDASWFSKAKREGAAQGARRSAIEASLDVKPAETGDKYGTANRTNKMVGGAFERFLSSLEKAMGYELNVTDEFSKGGISEETLRGLQQFVDAGKLTTEEAAEIAKQEMLYRTFQDETMASNVLKGLKQTLNKVGFPGGEFGLGDLVCKYTQVPGALLTRQLEFSPFGYLKAISLLAHMAKTKGQLTAMEQRNLALSITRATTGTGLIMLFAALAKAGIMTRPDDRDDADARALLAASGITGTQFNLSAALRALNGESYERQDGDTLMDIAFLEPLSGLMTIGTLLNGSKADDAVGKWADSMILGTWQAFSDLSVMSTIKTLKDAITYADGETGYEKTASIALEFAMSNVSGFIPAPIRQTAQAFDPFYRDSYGSTDAATNMKYQVMSAIPGLREKVPEKLTAFGDTKEYGGSAAQRFLNAFVNPGNVRTYRSDPTAEKVLDVYEKTGDATIIPDRNAARSVTFDKQKYVLTDEQRREYLMTAGATEREWLDQLFQSDEFNALDPTDQATLIKSVNSKAKDFAKTTVLNSAGVDSVKLLSPAVQREIDRLGVAGETGLSPSIPADSEISVPGRSGYEYQLTDAQMTAYQKLYRDTYEQSVSDLISSDAYKAAGDAEKAEMIRMVRDYVKETAKAQTLADDTLTPVLKANDELYGVRDAVMKGGTLDSVKQDLLASATRDRDMMRALTPNASGIETDEELREKIDAQVKTAASSTIKNAYVNGEMTEEQAVDALMKYGVSTKKTEAKQTLIEAQLGKSIGTAARDGDISEKEYTKYYLDTHDGKTDNDAFWAYQSAVGDEGYKMYNRLADAVRNQTNLTETIRFYTEHGKDEEDLRSAITSAFKAEFKAATDKEREAMMSWLVTAYTELGLTEYKARKNILKWLDD